MSEETHPDTKSLHAAITLIADIRRSVGDSKGKLMQDELVAHCGEIYKRSGMYDRLNESTAKNKRLFADEFAERVIESQKKRIHQLETELIEAKYQLRQNEKPTTPVCRACSGDGYVEIQSGPYTRKCEDATELVN